MRGRKPKPTWLKIIEGKRGHRALNVNEPIPKDPLGPAPADFTERQRAIWDHAAASAPPGLLTELDRQLFITYCVASALHEEARVKVAQIGALIKAPVTGVPMQSPWLTIMNKQAAVMQKAIAEIGFSPTSRGRVKLDRPAPDAGSGFDDLKEITD